MKTTEAKKIVKTVLENHGIPYTKLTAQTEKSFRCSETGEAYVTVYIHADNPHPNFSKAKKDTPKGILFIPKIPNVVST